MRVSEALAYVQKVVGFASDYNIYLSIAVMSLIRESLGPFNPYAP